MSTEDPRNDLNQIWRDQPVEEVGVTLEQIRLRADTLATKIGRRNRREYIAAAFVIAFFGLSSLWGQNALVAGGGLLVVPGTLYVVYHLHKRGSVRSMPAELGLSDCLAFPRAELIRQRDLLQSVWWWYLGPLVPGMVLMFIGWATVRPTVGLFVLTLFVAVTFVGIGALNQYAARRIQQRIDRLIVK